MVGDYGPCFTLYRSRGGWGGGAFCLQTLALFGEIGFGGGSVMALGGISHRSELLLVVAVRNLTGVRYREEILPLPPLQFRLYRDMALFPNRAKPSRMRQ